MSERINNRDGLDLHLNKIKCNCTPAYWLHDENQWEPPIICDQCQEEGLINQELGSFFDFVNANDPLKLILLDQLEIPNDPSDLPF